MTDERRQLPTPEWCKHHLGRAFEGEDGLYHLQFVTYRDVLLDMGYIDNQQAYALDRYALAHYVSTRHLAAKTANLSEVLRSAEITADELPTMRDMHRFVMQRLTADQASLINAVVDDIPPDSNIFAVRRAMTALSSQIDRVANIAQEAVEDFYSIRDKMLSHKKELC